jgi:diacylglycerol kinase (ATP)
MVAENQSENALPEQTEQPEGLAGRIRSMLGGYRTPSSSERLVHVIINPAAGRDQPILSILNNAMKTAGVEWDLFITKDAGDAARLARRAARRKADLVAVYGGDGTVMEAATGLIGTDVPLAILPGGTANVMAVEIGLLGDLVDSCAIALNPNAQIRKVDMGRIGGHYFLLRAGMGFEAEMVEGADRELKDRIGVLAYGLSALQALVDPPMARYRLDLDGRIVETEGLTCLVANSGAIGVGGRSISLAQNISVSDGLLDVIVVRKADLPSLLSVAANIVSGEEDSEDLLHWQVKEVMIQADPAQKVQADGEMIGETPVTARVIPHAVNLIVPTDREVE